MFQPKKETPKNFESKDSLRVKSASKVIALSKCLEELQANMKSNNGLAGIWREWGEIVGEPLASNCQPINIWQGILYVGSKHPQWRQALIYNRAQLLEVIKNKGYTIKEIRVKQYYPESIIELESEEIIWKKHPSRVDIHGLSTCKKCGSPAPTGEMELWGRCSFCRRQILKG